ncbi:MAG: hypothetical protein WBG42_00195, partial [Cryomorphaceae bacterium]
INALKQSAGIDRIEVSAIDSGALAWRVSAERLFIDNLSVISLLIGEGIQLDSLLISGMEVTFHKITKPADRPDSLESELKSRMPVEINGFRITSGKFDYNPAGAAQATGVFNYLLSDFKRDSLAAIDIKSLYVNSHFNLRVDQMTSKDSLYTTYIHSIRKTRGETLILDSLSLIPNQSLSSFTRHFGWNKAMLKLGISKIQTSIDLTHFPDSISLPFCTVEGSQLEVNKDNRWPFPDRVTPLPQEMLAALPFKIQIDSVLISDAHVELNLIQESGKEASLRIENIETTVSAQNLDETKPALVLNSTQNVTGSASSTISTIYRYGENSPFEFALTMENSNLKFMSDFLQESIGIKITDGRSNRLNLEMTGNKYASEGRVLFEYTDLSIAAVNKETGKEKKILNMLADVLGSMVFWKENPANGNYRNGTFSVKRDVRKAFLAQWVEGLEAGVVSIVAKIDPLKSRGKTGKNKR